MSNLHKEHTGADWDFSFMHEDENDNAIALTGYIYVFKLIDEKGIEKYSSNGTVSGSPDELILKVNGATTTDFDEGKYRYQWKVTTPDTTIDLTDIGEFYAVKSII